ncbi:unnamed protein product [Rotaria sp. Silwood2]|nr:unnamed protein product [Rotaria sp. Silwood2]
MFYCLDETRFTHTLKKQIVSLIIDIDTNGRQTSTKDVNVILFTQILSTFTNLQSLKFGLSSIWYQLLAFSIPPSTVITSTLLELHKNLPNLRTVSLQCDMSTSYYDELIVPLLHRMIDLEQLDLSLFVCGRKTFVDGYDLNRNVIDHMAQLNTFTFNIRSESRFYNKVNLPSNEDIQKTFKNFKNNKIISCVDYFQDMNYNQCHIYSQPYKLKHYHNITNKFSGGLFICVREVSLFDERPFEHEFFLLIQKSFPLMENLTVINRKR